MQLHTHITNYNLKSGEYLMKALYLILSVLIALNSQFSFALTGGVSGGGGYVINPTLPEKYQDPELVESMVKCTLKPVQDYLQKKNLEFNSGKLAENEIEIFTKIFTTPLSIHDALKKVKLDVTDEKPCFDSENKPVDGSIFHKNKKAVCISAKNIADKVHFNEIKAQSAALIIHEYTEVIGLTEEGAIEVQKISLDEFKRKPIPNNHNQY